MASEADFDEKAIVEQIRRGNRAAFNMLVRKYSPLVINLVYRLTGSRMDAEDVAQDVFVEIYRHFDSFRGDSPLSTWIYRIAHNRALNFLRDSKRSRTVSLDSDSADAAAAANIPANESSQPDQMLNLKESREMLYRAIARLPRKYQEPFTLHKLDGMPYEQIAAVLGLSHSAVETRIHRAKTMLQKELVDDITKNKRLQVSDSGSV